MDPQGFDARPEHVVVFELERGNVSRLFEAARQGPVEWLFDADCLTKEDDDSDEDDDQTESNPEREGTSTHLYLMFTSVESVNDLLRAWRSWQGGHLPGGLGYWGDLFELLRVDGGRDPRIS